MDVVPASLTKHLKQCGAHIVVHGHTHKPGHTSHLFEEESYCENTLLHPLPPSLT